MRFVTEETELRSLVGGAPLERTLRKRRDRLDDYAREFLAAAPFCVLATADAHGNCDATPRGDQPGFALALDDHTLALPERPGNRLIDSLTNLLTNPRIGLVFVVPGVAHTLRVNGSARLVSDAAFFDRMTVFGKPPLLAVLVDVAECYFHCGKAFVRSQLWDTDSWPAPGAVTSLGTAMRGQLDLDADTAAGIDHRSSVAYRTNMF